MTSHSPSQTPLVLSRKTAFIALFFSVFAACNGFLAYGGVGVSMEDAAIHLAAGAGLFSEGFFSLSGGAPTGAATSPLWVVLNGLLFFLSGSISFTVTALSALTVAALASGLFLLFESENRLLAVMVSAFSLCMGPVLWHVFSGMETGLFCAAVFWTGHFLLAGRTRAASLAASTACLLRIEGVLLVLLIGGALLLRRRRGGGELPAKAWRDGLAFPSAAFGLVLVLNMFHTGRAMPSTGDAKRMLFGVYHHGLDAIPDLGGRLWDMGSAWWALFLNGLGANGVVWLFSLTMAFSVIGLIALIKGRSRALCFFAGWTLLLNGAYGVELPLLEVAGRYQATNLFWIPIGLAGCVSMFVDPVRSFPAWKERMAPWRQGFALVGAMIALTMVANLSMTGVRWGNGRALQMAHLDAVHERAGVWLAEHNPDCLPIILGEVGWIAFFNQAPRGCGPLLFDYYGVANPTYFADVREGKAFSSALEGREEAFFALSLLSTNFHGVHLRMHWPDAPPGSWRVGHFYRGKETTTGAEFLFRVENVFGFDPPAERPFVWPVGESTAMNPMVVGRVRRVQVR